MADARRFRIIPAMRIQAVLCARITMMLGAMLASLLISACGIQVAGGTSEVGNPSNAILAEPKKEKDTTTTEVGVRLDFTGSPIQILKAKKTEPKAEDSASAKADDSASVNGTPSPSN
jgi:hypothetical protein